MSVSQAAQYQLLVRALSAYISAESQPESQRFVFHYRITMANTGTAPARLLGRRWLITDGNGQVQEVAGEGVVGQNPYLTPGEEYSYSSGCVLETPVGSMRGSYQMLADDGHEFDAPIPIFTLSVPGALH